MENGIYGNVYIKGAGFIKSVFVFGGGGIWEGATLHPNICNTENYDNSLYKGTSNWLVSHCK